jgi:hypothetical protein
VKRVAADSIDDLLDQLEANCGTATMMGHSQDHVGLANWAFRSLQYCLHSQPFSAPSSAEALDHIWYDQCSDQCIGHMVLFRDAGLDMMVNDCLRMTQDAIALSMIRDGTMQHMMDVESTSDTSKSRLRHSYFIMQRYFRDVGHHLQNLPHDGFDMAATVAAADSAVADVAAVTVVAATVAAATVAAADPEVDSQEEQQLIQLMQRVRVANSS